jgi:UDP-glucose 4-epimerase
MPSGRACAHLTRMKRASRAHGRGESESAGLRPAVLYSPRVRVAVTGIASDFGTVLAPLLFEDDDVSEVIGIDLREPRVAHSKLRFEREDVRSERLKDLFEGCEAVVHLAFVVGEIHDKELTHSINLGGSKNVIQCCHEAGTRRLVVASSIASYGVHSDHPIPITEEEFPRGNPDKYYFYDKAEVEHYVEWWERRHPDAEMVITRLRPPFIVGPHFLNPAIETFSSSSATVPSETGSGIQLLWEDDLARAFHLAVTRDAPGPFNLATEDWLSSRELAALHGQRLRRLPAAVAAPIAEVLFRLRLSPVSSHWVIAGEGIVSAEKIERELGWEPTFTSAESARMLLVQRGRPLLPGRSGSVFARKDVAEKTLEPMTARLRSWAGSIPALRHVLESPGEIDRMVARVEHAVLPYRDTQVHLEIHPAERTHRGTVVFSPGIGGYARFYLPFLGKLCDEGFDVVAVDRPGHGLSEGRRGDCTIEQTLDVVEATVRYAREHFGGPVALAGSSLGGIITWYALTREPDVEAAVCHNVAHPGIPHEPAARIKVPLLKRLAAVAPFAPVSIKRIADFDAVAVSPEVLDYFRREVDAIWSWTITARSAASLFTFEPRVEWSRVEIPTLVLVGANDRMVSPEFTEQVLGVGRPARSELRLLPGSGHMLLLDHLDQALPTITGWLDGALQAPVGVTRGGQEAA